MSHQLKFISAQQIPIVRGRARSSGPPQQIRAPWNQLLCHGTQDCSVTQSTGGEAELRGRTPREDPAALFTSFLPATLPGEVITVLGTTLVSPLSCLIVFHLGQICSCHKKAPGIMACRIRNLVTLEVVHAPEPLLGQVQG